MLENHKKPHEKKFYSNEIYHFFRNMKYFAAESHVLMIHSSPEVFILRMICIWIVVKFNNLNFQNFIRKDVDCLSLQFRSMDSSEIGGIFP